MQRRIRSLGACFILAWLSSIAVCVAQQPQPAVEGSGDAPKPSPAPAPSDALLTSPDAREVAVYACAAANPAPSPACPLTSELARTIAAQFNQPLLGGDGKDTSFAQALKAILGGTFKGDVIWSTTAPAAVVHVVDHGGAAGKVHDRWILATRRWSAVELSERRRIYGAKTMTVVFVHVNAVVPKSIDPSTVYADISYRAIVKRKTPANIQNLLDLLRLAGAAQAKGDEATAAFMGFGALTHIAVPSDVTVLGLRTGAMTIVGQTAQYDNEGKYLWDASVAVPVNKLSLLDYSQDNNTFTPKQINKQSVYGVINLYPIPVDTKEGNLRWILPRVIAGLGFTGRPGESVLVGGAWGFSQLQFFVGAAFANHLTLIEGKDPKVATSYEQRYQSTFTFGINVPVVSALKQVMSKSAAPASTKAGQ